ncbi:MAG: HEWD family protein [Halodesulfurarchaeum sp.]
MTLQIRRPDRRTCLRCGRTEEWDEAGETWRAVEVGSVFCVHEWDITGTFNPIENPE